MLVFPELRAALARAEIDLEAATLGVQALDATAVADPAMVFLDEITGGLLGTADLIDPVTLVVTDVGVDVQAPPATLTDIDDPDVVTGLLVWVDTGDPATSHLAAFIDHTAGGPPIRVRGAGLPITVTWPQGYVFQL